MSAKAQRHGRTLAEVRTASRRVRDLIARMGDVSPSRISYRDAATMMRLEGRVREAERRRWLLELTRAEWELLERLEEQLR